MDDTPFDVVNTMIVEGFHCADIDSLKFYKSQLKSALKETEKAIELLNNRPSPNQLNLIADE